MSLEEVGVLPVRCAAQVTVGWREVCRQPCASCHLLEGLPWRQLQRAACPTDALSGAPASGDIRWHLAIRSLMASQTPARPSPRLSLLLIALAFYLFLCPVCFLLSLLQKLIPNKHLDLQILFQLLLLENPACSSEFCHLFVKWFSAAGLPAATPPAKLSWEPLASLGAQDLLNHFSSECIELSPSLTLHRGLAFEEFGLGWSAEADSSV